MLLASVPPGGVGGARLSRNTMYLFCGMPLGHRYDSLAYRETAMVPGPGQRLERRAQGPSQGGRAAHQAPRVLDLLGEHQDDDLTVVAHGVRRADARVGE